MENENREQGTIPDAGETTGEGTPPVTPQTNPPAERAPAHAPNNGDAGESTSSDGVNVETEEQ